MEFLVCVLDRLVAEAICPFSKFERQILWPMGKHLQHKYSASPMENSDPGCVWSLLHTIKYHHWRYFKKRLTPKWHGNGIGRGRHVARKQHFLCENFLHLITIGSLVALERHVNLVSILSIFDISTIWFFRKLLAVWIWIWYLMVLRQRQIGPRKCGSYLKCISFCCCPMVYYIV